MIKIKLLLIILFTFMSINSVQAFNLFGKKNMGFRFEDYKNAEEAEEALLKLHAVGSDVSTLKKTLEDAGASCSLRSSTSVLIHELRHSGDFMICSDVKKGILSDQEWRAIVDVELPRTNEIKKLKILLLNHLKFVP